MRRVWSMSGLACAAVMAACMSPARAQEARGISRVLLDRRLQERTVQLVGVEDKTLMYTDSAGLVRTEVMAEFLAIMPGAAEDGPSEVHHPASVIELSDGQRFVGSLVAGKNTPDMVVWDHVALGVMEFKLDQVRRIQLQGGPTASRRAGDASADSVVLVNGDRLDGFVDVVGGIVGIDINGSHRELPADRVQEILLSGAEQKQAPGPLAWLKDGSIVACRAIHSTRVGELVVTPRVMVTEQSATEAPAPMVTLRLDDLTALAIEPSILTPLASLPVVKEEAGSGRRWTRPAMPIDPRWAPLGLADIELPGPMTVEWTLPAGPLRFSAEAELPRQMWTWGDCELVVSVVGAETTELWRRRINAEAARARIAVTLGEGAGKRLRITLEPGEFGPVQDKIVLRRGMVVGEKK